MKPFKKISEVKSFTIEKIVKVYFERWNEQEGKYEKSDVYQQGFSQKYLIETFDSLLPLSKDQLQQCLIACLNLDGTANIIGKSFSVKTNGKTGKEIRYWINKMSIPQDIPTQMPEISQDKPNYTVEKEEMTPEEIASIPF